MQERRKFPRYDCSLKVNYVADGVASVGGVSMAKDISKGGLRLLVYRMIKKGNLLDIKIFPKNNNEAVEVVGRVRWVNEGLATYSPVIDAGIQFTDIKPTDADQLLANIR